MVEVELIFAKVVVVRSSANKMPILAQGWLHRLQECYILRKTI